MYLVEEGGFQQTTFQLHGVACQKHQSAPCRLASRAVLHGLYQMWPYLSGGLVASILSNERESKFAKRDKVSIE